MPGTHLGAGLQPVLSLQRFFGCDGETGLLEGVAQFAGMLRRGPCPISRKRPNNSNNRKRNHHACEAE